MSTQKDIIKPGIEYINDERNRQVNVEGYTPEDDDRYIQGELEDAADAYYFHARSENTPKPVNWPWEKESWKPSGDMVRNYSKAGALYMAESARQLRGTSKGPSTQADLDEMIEACAFKIDEILKKRKK